MKKKPQEYRPTVCLLVRKQRQAKANASVSAIGESRSSGSHASQTVSNNGGGSVLGKTRLIVVTIGTRHFNLTLK